MSIQPGQGPLIPSLAAMEGQTDKDETTQDEGVPVGDADVEADKQNAKARSDSETSSGTDGEDSA